MTLASDLRETVATLTTKYDELDDKMTKMSTDMKDAVKDMKLMFLEAFKNKATSQSNGGYRDGAKTEPSDTGIEGTPLAKRPREED